MNAPVWQQHEHLMSIADALLGDNGSIDVYGVRQATLEHRGLRNLQDHAQNVAHPM